MIPSPYLLYLGATTDHLSAKTARGIAQWRPDLCVGQRRLPGATVTLGLEDLEIGEAVRRGARTMIVGETNAGGVLNPTAIPEILSALKAGMDVASGLHQRLTDIPEIRRAASRNGRQLFDVREPPADLVVGKGYARAGRRLLTVGTDCSVGKMYTTLALEKAMRARGLKADFRATGQTGILIAGDGVPVDAVIADFISGAVERISPARTDGGWDLIEGQGSLFHPSFAGVSLGLLHGAQPAAIVLCSEPGRAHMRGVPGRPVPSLEETLRANLEAAKVTSPDCVAVGIALNTSHLTPEEARRGCDEASAALNLPCQDPIAMGVDLIVDHLLQCFEASTPRTKAFA
ncbi:MAG TPA: N-acetyltransferase DgcN [Caulobacteraceae bacterium]|nr:N-acetyltransferase DgcN [Caulobacteraceae bacterium]